MVESTTLNYHWTKPELTKSPSTWGKFLNDDLDAIDGLVFANQQAIVPIGAITMFGGAAAPANWLICDGRTLEYGATPAYQALFNVIGRAFNPALSGTQFALPNMSQKFPLGVDAGNPLGRVGGTFSYTLALANMPVHNHSASQDAHNHGITTGGHAHNISTGGHSHTLTTNAHVHGGQLMRFVGSGGTLGVGVSPNNVTGGNNTDAATVTGSADFVGNLGGATETVGNLGGSTDIRTPNVYTGNTGSGAAFNVVQPFLAINFIIRYQ